MRIRLSGHPELVIDLRDHLRGVGCIAVEVAPGLIEASIPDAPSAAQEWRELRAYLGTWMAARGVDAELEEEVWGGWRDRPATTIEEGRTRERRASRTGARCDTRPAKIQSPDPQKIGGSAHAVCPPSG
jgi:hypothetical protein